MHIAHTMATLFKQTFAINNAAKEHKNVMQLTSNSFFLSAQLDTLVSHRIPIPIPHMCITIKS